METPDFSSTLLIYRFSKRIHLLYQRTNNGIPNLHLNILNSSRKTRTNTSRSSWGLRHLNYGYIFFVLCGNNSHYQYKKIHVHKSEYYYIWRGQWLKHEKSVRWIYQSKYECDRKSTRDHPCKKKGGGWDPCFRCLWLGWTVNSSVHYKTYLSRTLWQFPVTWMWTLTPSTLCRLCSSVLTKLSRSLFKITRIWVWFVQMYLSTCIIQKNIFWIFVYIFNNLI